MAEVVILGAGLTGLSCAYHLEKYGFSDFKIFEKESLPGGLLRSFKVNGFTFDFTGHLLHVSNDYFLSFLHDVANLKNFDLVNRNSVIYLRKCFTKYPIQMNLYGLPDDIILDSIYGFINRKKHIKSPKNFYQWVLKYFGSGLGKHFFFTYNKKLLSYDVKKITPSWTGRFVPQTNLKAILKSALGNNSQLNVGYNSQFYYPKNGGIEFLIKSLRSKIQSKIYTNYNATSINTKTNTIYFENGHKEKYKKLVTTMPLNTLLKNLEEPANSNLRTASDKLICNSVINFNLGFNISKLTDNHWIYFPEEKFPFYRVGFWQNVSPTSVKKNHSAIYGELSYISGTKTDKQLQNLVKKSIDHTLSILGLKKSNIVTQKMLHLPNAYVIYNFWREKNLASILKKLEEKVVFSVGRYGEWKYSSMQEAVLDGEKVSKKILAELCFNRSRQSNEDKQRVLQ